MTQFRTQQRVRVTVGNRAPGRIVSGPLALSGTPGIVYAVELEAGEWLAGAGVHVCTLLVSSNNLEPCYRVVPEGRGIHSRAMTVPA